MLKFMFLTITFVVGLGVAFIYVIAKFNLLLPWYIVILVTCALCLIGTCAAAFVAIKLDRL